MEDFKLEKREWWSQINQDIKELLLESVVLVKEVSNWEKRFRDYSFVVFPAAKAYEGYLKNVFLERGFIDEKEFYGKQFRIGKSLNPSFKPKSKKSVYSKIADYCGSRDLAQRMWDTWINCRNVLFHWFPNEKNAIDISEARERVMQILSTMDAVSKECKMV